MADEVTQNQADQRKQESSNADTDSLLKTLVRLAERTGTDIPLTLDIKGTVITGRLISRKDYLTALATLFRQGMPGSNESGKTFLDTFARAIEEQVKEMPDLRANPEEEKEEEDYPKFILLKSAKRVYPTHISPTGVGGLWRGLISSVDGFSFGVIELD